MSSPTRDPGGPVLALLSWLVIICAVVYIMYTRMVPPAERAPAAAATPAAEQYVAPPGLFGMVAKPLVAVEDSPAERAKGIDDLIPLLAHTPADHLRATALIAEVKSTKDAVARLDEIAHEFAPDSRLAKDAALFRVIYTEGAPALSVDAINGLLSRHGFFARLALVAGKPDSDPERVSVMADSRAALHVILTAYGVFGVILVAALVCFITAIVMFFTGSIKRAYAPPAPGGSVFLETFALFLASFLALSFISPVVEPYLKESTGLLRWLCVLVPLYPLLRGVPWANLKFAIGWHTGRGVIREVFAGVFGYLALMPVVAAGIGLTFLLMFLAGLISGKKEGTLPVHPLGDMLAQTSSIWQVIALFALATVWAPVVEESVFRGAFFHHLRGRLPCVLAALLVGFVFAAIHPQGWVAIPVLGAMGMNFCLLREWRGSLIAPMVAHALNNGAITTLLILMLRA